MLGYCCQADLTDPSSETQFLKEVVFLMVLWTETWAGLTAAAVVVSCQTEAGFLSECVYSLHVLTSPLFQLHTDSHQNSMDCHQTQQEAAEDHRSLRNNQVLDSTADVHTLDCCTAPEVCWNYHQKLGTVDLVGKQGPSAGFEVVCSEEMIVVSYCHLYGAGDHCQCSFLHLSNWETYLMKHSCCHAPSLILR